MSVPLALIAIILSRLAIATLFFLIYSVAPFGQGSGPVRAIINDMTTEGVSTFIGIITFYNMVPEHKKNFGSFFCIIILLLSGFSLGFCLIISKEYSEIFLIVPSIVATVIALFQIREGKAPSFE